ncbi:MAG: D-alanyl-D-alanine carboxypeptidase/D-alanyl-D-alanine-endopeptidase [Gemmatimonadaceae bacterium]|nr:D-alanyl-D-alanine carboxypeptidase/D-alanyl-D-alanine-endopeptidase [Gemmatimonadaceae bacterium]
MSSLDATRAMQRAPRFLALRVSALATTIGACLAGLLPTAALATAATSATATTVTAIAPMALAAGTIVAGALVTTAAAPTALPAQGRTAKKGATAARRATTAKRATTSKAAARPKAQGAKGTTSTRRAATSSRRRAAAEQPPRRGRRGVVRPVRAVAPRAPAIPLPVATMPIGVAQLRADLASMITTGARTGTWSAMVVSLSSGDTLLAMDADQPHMPASTMKLLTAALALEKLGPQHRFRTEILHTGRIDEGVVQGDLILRGDGDPSFSTRFLGPRPDAAMDSLAQAVVRRGVRRVTGRIIGDASAFEARPTPEGWLPRILDDSYAGKVSALSVNEGIVWVTVRPEGGRAVVTLEPASVAMPIAASVRVVRGGGASIRAVRSGAGVTVRGTIGANAGQRSYGLIIPDPSAFTTGAFVAALQRAGVEVSGAWAVAPAPGDASPLAAIESQPVETLVTVMNRESVNPIAEHLLRAATRGRERTGVGTAAAAERQLRELLGRGAGVSPSQLWVRDGSGLSTLDRVSARALVQTLAFMDRGRHRTLWHASLPLAGESGTLRTRLLGTAAQANLHAKTGTTNDIVALAGYVTARNGELLAFAMLYNGSDRWRAGVLRRMEPVGCPGHPHAVGCVNGPLRAEEEPVATYVGVHTAKTTLSKLIERAEAGEDIVITRDGEPVARLVPVAPAPGRTFGRLRGLGRLDASSRAGKVGAESPRIRCG